MCVVVSCRVVSCGIYLKPVSHPPSPPSRLLEHAVNLILVVQLEGLGRVVRVDPLPVQEEPEGPDVDALALRVRVHHLGHLRGLFYFEERLLASLVFHADCDGLGWGGGRMKEERKAMGRGGEGASITAFRG